MVQLIFFLLLGWISYVLTKRRPKTIVKKPLPDFDPAFWSDDAT